MLFCFKTQHSIPHRKIYVLTMPTSDLHQPGLHLPDLDLWDPSLQSAHTWTENIRSTKLIIAG